jgi:hypothetical protein
LQTGRQAREDFAVGIGYAAAGIDQQQHHVGTFDFLPAAFDADLLDDILGVPQASGIDDVQWNAFDLDGRAQGIARGAGNRCDDGQIVAGQAVEQGGLADIGLAGENDVQAGLQQFALAGAVEDFGQLQLQAFETAEASAALRKSMSSSGKSSVASTNMRRLISSSVRP